MNAAFHVLAGSFEEIAERDGWNIDATSRLNQASSKPKWSSIETALVRYSHPRTVSMQPNLTPLVEESEFRLNNKACSRNKTWMALLSLLLLLGTTTLVTIANGTKKKDNGRAYHEKQDNSIDHNQRRLSDTNIFQKSYPKFLVQWGIVRRGCRPPPQATLQLECQGGLLQVLQDHGAALSLAPELCQQVSPNRMDCFLDRSSVEFNGADWMQGMVVASCDKCGDSQTDAVPTFSATFDMTFPSSCVGIRKDDTEDGAVAVGGYENYLITSQLCATSKNQVHTLPVPFCTMGTELQFETTDDQTATLCQETDYCRVPKCPVGFLCDDEDLTRCKVQPSAIKSFPHTTQTCQAMGLEEVKENHQLWEVLEATRVTMENLVDAGLGSSTFMD